MKNKRSFSLSVFGMAILVSNTGCVNFYGGDVKSITLERTTWAREQKPNLYYEIAVVPYSGNGDTGLWSIPKNEAIFLLSSRLSKSGYFTSIQNTPPPKDAERPLHLKFKISMSQSQEMGLLIGAGACWLYIIPVWFTNSIQMDAELLRDGKVLTSYNYNGECTNFWWTLLFVTAPFSTYSGAINKIVTNGTDQIIKRVKDDGYLPAARGNPLK